jgi:putative ABC transport system substrate-binding protein
MVAINYDPIALGFIESIARPGANVTGLFFQHLGLLAKRFGLFKEMLPTIKLWPSCRMRWQPIS